MRHMSKAINKESFSDPELAQALAKSIATHSPKHAKLMEVCGTHTMSIAKSGLRDLLPSSIELISGPGCPVCVTPTHAIDQIIALSMMPNIVLATFGDMIRVPGSNGSLQEARANGADVRVVYSPLDALAIANENPEREVVFAGVGFETTAPLVAATIKRAQSLKTPNFSVACTHKTIPHALDVLAGDNKIGVDAFILPGHVSTIIGTRPYDFLATKYRIPGLVAGFEPLDILQGIAMICRQLINGEAKIEIAYARGASPQGNPTAVALMNEVFEECDSVWRGLGTIPMSGLQIREEFSNFDALRRFSPDVPESSDPPGCKCADVLRGLIKPSKCPLFGKVCTPADPVGPCMVSSEGSCAAYFKYGLD